jgi:hypothetical protein
MRRPLGGPPRPRACGTDPCAPSDANRPVTDAQARCGLGVQLQGTVDAARRITHTHGLRPYRVFLVWQERYTERVWQTVRELELVPVKALGMHEIELAVTPAGVLPTGPVKLREVSRAQVNEDTLRGWLDGEEWSGADREFFYEVRLMARCAGEEPRRRRFVIAGEPEARAFEWIVRLTDSMPARDRAGNDATVAEPELGQDGAKLVY